MQRAPQPFAAGPVQPERPYRDVEVAPAQPGRPYQDYVENETDKYWQEIVRPGSLAKPDVTELRAGARPVLGKALRRRQHKIPDPALAYYRAHQAVNAVHLHAAERGWIKPPYSRPAASTNYAEALIQLADDAGWLAREIPLPEHPNPQHPTIYYTMNTVSGFAFPVPREDALLRGNYVYDPETGSRITQDDYIHAWADPHYRFPLLCEIIARDWNAYYTLFEVGKTVVIAIYWINPEDSSEFNCARLTRLYFSPVFPPQP